MASSENGDVVLEEDDEIYEKGDKVKSFHHQANQPMSPISRLLVHVAQEVCGSISSTRWDPAAGVFSVVQLAYGRPLRLLPAMICCIQCVLRALTEAFCKPTTMKRAGYGQVFFFVMDHILGWSLLTLIWWRDLHYTIHPWSSQGKKHQKTFASHIFVVLRIHNGKGSTLWGFGGWFVAMMLTTFSNVSLTSLALDMAKSFEIKEMSILYLGKKSSNGWSASGHPIYYISEGMSATWNPTCPTGLHDSSNMTDCLSLNLTLFWRMLAVWLTVWAWKYFIVGCTRARLCMPCRLLIF